MDLMESIFTVFIGVFRISNYPIETNKKIYFYLYKNIGLGLSVCLFNESFNIYTIYGYILSIYTNKYYLRLILYI